MIQSSLRYIYAFQVIYSSQPQAQVMKYSSPSSYYSASGNDVPLHRNEYWRHPSDYSTKYDGSGLCEIVILVIVFFIWFCSIRKLYYVWKNTLGFSEDMVQGPQGWDFIFNWMTEKRKRRRKNSLLRLHELRVPLFFILLSIKLIPQQVRNILHRNTFF